MTSEPPYTVFYKDKVQLRPHLTFLQKILSQFHANWDIFLPVFFPKPHASNWQWMLHSLDVRQVLAFYIEQTKRFRKSTQLFIAIAEWMRGLLVSSQRISSWIMACIRTCYDLAKIPALAITAYSMRLQASLAAFLADVPIQDICRAATSSIHTFMSYYTITQQARDDLTFGSAVQQSVTQ